MLLSQFTQGCIFSCCNLLGFNLWVYFLLLSKICCFILSTEMLGYEILCPLKTIFRVVGLFLWELGYFLCNPSSGSKIPTCIGWPSNWLVVLSSRLERKAQPGSTPHPRLCQADGGYMLYPPSAHTFWALDWPSFWQVTIKGLCTLHI